MIIVSSCACDDDGGFVADPPVAVLQIGPRSALQ
jgi:hypothetical protein